MVDDTDAGPAPWQVVDDVTDEVVLPDLILAGLPARADDIGPYCGPIIEKA